MLGQQLQLPIFYIDPMQSHTYNVVVNAGLVTFHYRVNFSQ